MKAKNVLIGLFLVLTLIFGLVLAGCDPGGSSSNRFVGTWIGYDLDGYVFKVVVDSSTWTLSLPDYPQWGVQTGTYTYSGNTGTMFLNGVAWATGTLSGNNTMTVTIPGYGTMICSKQ